MAKSKKQPKQAPAAPPVVVKRENKLVLVTVALYLLIIGVLAATAYARNSIYQTYVTLWKSVTESAPNKRRAHENYGQALSTAGSLSKSVAEARKYYEAALREFNTVIELKDDGSVPLRDLYREIGVVHFRMGRIDEAIAAWDKGLNYAPGDASLMNNLSIAFMQKGQFDKAATFAKDALMANPNMPQALNTLGQAYMGKQEYDKAAQFFLKAIEREPDVPARYWNAAIALEKSGKYEQALEYATQYASRETDPASRQRAAGFIQYIKNNSMRR